MSASEAQKQVFGDVTNSHATQLAQRRIKCGIDREIAIIAGAENQKRVSITLMLSLLC
jgi:hypothetical protein